MPDKEVRIFGAKDQPLPVGEVGDIVLRGGFMWGYWGNPSKTEEATRGGWLRTGDLGVIDHDGFITLRSRRAELLVVNGVPWYPRDVEEALCEEPGVRQAALIGLGIAGRDQKPTVFVTMLDGVSFDGAALKRAIAARLPYDLTPLSIRVVDALPMTPTGKISKGECRL